MDKSSTFRGVSKKKGRWEAKVMLNRKWAYRCGERLYGLPICYNSIKVKQLRC
jgi:hypothetical protein